MEEDVIRAGPVRGEGVVFGLLGFVGLLVDKLAADVVRSSAVADGLCAGEGVNSQALALVRGESPGRASVGRGGGGG
jgi:hypothetical protein